MDSKFCITLSIILVFVIISSASNKIYFIENTNFKNFPEARKECWKRHMNLVSIRSAEELEYLKEYIKNTYDAIYPYWLGAYRVNGQYYWIATGAKVEHFFWHKGEPNDKSGNEKCIHTWENDFDWNDNDCERELPYICELEV